MNSFYNGILSLTVFLLVLAPALQAQVAIPWMDDFEAYPNGTLLNGQNGWLGWDNNPAFAGTSTTAIPPSSAIEIQGTDDAVVYFTPVTTGQWTVRAMQYIPGNLVGTSFFILLNAYSHGGPYNWSTQVQFTGGNMVDDGSGATQPYVADQWVPIEVQIDLDADIQRFIYNGGTFYAGVWNGYITGAGTGNNAIEALDLFANGATSVYYDDVSIIATGLPVELSSFEAFVEARDVHLKWTTLSETDNSGFEVEMAQGDTFTQIGFVEGHGTSSQVHDYRFTVRDLQPGRHAFRLKQVDFDGVFEYSDVVEAIVTVPEGYLIGDVYPNPLSHAATINVGVETDQFVRVDVYNTLGQRVATPYARHLIANQMHPVRVDLSDLPSGPYVLLVQGTNWTTHRLVTLNK